MNPSKGKFITTAVAIFCILFGYSNGLVAFQANLTDGGHEFIFQKEVATQELHKSHAARNFEGEIFLSVEENEEKNSNYYLHSFDGVHPSDFLNQISKESYFDNENISAHTPLYILFHSWKSHLG
jgi:hypothetical protein